MENLKIKKVEDGKVQLMEMLKGFFTIDDVSIVQTAENKIAIYSEKETKEDVEEQWFEITIMAKNNKDKTTKNGVIMAYDPFVEKQEWMDKIAKKQESAKKKAEKLAKVGKAKTVKKEVVKDEIKE
jgi:hypothetical protein